jgi:hypothetical protein
VTVETQAGAGTTRAGSVAAELDSSNARLWLVLGDTLPNRVFLDCGIVDGLRGALDDRLVPIARSVVGSVDGRAAERVVEAIVGPLGRE